MVRADGGIMCIDEFDKMRPEDRVALHEVTFDFRISHHRAGSLPTCGSARRR